MSNTSTMINGSGASPASDTASTVLIRAIALLEGEEGQPSALTSQDVIDDRDE
jgi:hypothetical protein